MSDKRGEMKERKYTAVKLRVPVKTKDDPRRYFCGPYSLMAITGHKYRDIQSHINYYRWRSKRAAVKGVHNSEMKGVLRDMGYTLTEVVMRRDEKSGQLPTLAKFLRERRGEKRRKLLLINITDHYVVVQGNRFIDTHTREIVTIRKAPHRRCRVQRYWEIS